MGTDWFATTRVTAPPKLDMGSRESRKVAVSLTPALGVGETVVNGSVVVDVVNWRTMQPIDPSPLVGLPGYDAVTKIAAQQIDGSKLPPRTHCAFRVRFGVTSVAGTETRSVYVILYVDV
jgi:hypothetical protein